MSNHQLTACVHSRSPSIEQAGGTVRQTDIEQVLNRLGHCQADRHWTGIEQARTLSSTYIDQAEILNRLGHRHNPLMSTRGCQHLMRWRENFHPSCFALLVHARKTFWLAWISGVIHISYLCTCNCACKQMPPLPPGWLASATFGGGQWEGKEW